MGRRRKYEKLTIKRTYTSKKTGETITKTYKYDRKPTKKKYEVIGTYQVGDKTKRLTHSTKLIDKKGNFKEEAINALSKRTGVDTLTIKSTVKAALRSEQKINIKAITATLTNSIVERFLTNLDIDLDELLEELQVKLPQANITRDWILDTSHWQKSGAYRIYGPLTLPNGLGKVDFYWDYDNGSTYEIKLNTEGE